MLISATAPPPSSSLPLGGTGPYCFKSHVESIICSTSYGFSGSWIKTPFELHRGFQYQGLSFTSENPFSGTTRYHWLPQIHDSCLSQVSVAADYSDSVPDSSSYANHNGYHPLEELRDHGRVRDKMPTSAEIARTVVEANQRALLIFPSVVHCEPHGQISWAEFQYVIDDFGDMFFEVDDGRNILQDYEASNPVSALIEMDISHYESRKIDLYDDIIFDFDAGDVLVANDYNEIEDPSQSDIWASWGMPERSTWTHPVYFAKCLTKTIDVEHIKMMDHPSNGVVLWGFLRPVFIDEETYVRRLFNNEESDGYSSDCEDEDIVSFSSRDDGSSTRSTIYRLEIAKIELFSVYGVQSVINVEDFQYAEPDVLVHSMPSILERFDVTGTRCNAALKALCKKKGLHVEGTNLIGVDSLGIDVRVSSGTEVWTHRFSFKVRATTECAAEKQIQQLLFPRARRKKSTLYRPTEIN